VAGQGDRFPGSAGLHLADGVALLHPEEQVFEAMLFPSQRVEIVKPCSPPGLRQPLWRVPSSRWASRLPGLALGMSPSRRRDALSFGRLGPVK
jgi:hypothetical protein